MLPTAALSCYQYPVSISQIKLSCLDQMGELVQIVPTAHSVWIDMPRHLGTSDTAGLLKLLHEIIGCCRKFGRPFAFFKSDGNFFNNKADDQSKEWMQFREANKINFQTVCSCDCGDESIKDLHWKRQVFSFNFPHTLSHTSCTCKTQGKVNKVKVPQYNLTLYECISRILLDPTSKVGSTGKSTGAEARKTVPHGVQRAKRAEATELTGAEARKTKPSSRPLSSDVLHTAQLSIDTHRSDQDETKRSAAKPSITATQRLPDSSLIESSPTADTVVCFADALDKIATCLAAKTVQAEAYPTDSKEREKQRKKEAKERGEEIVVKKKHKPIENHFDDCGEDVSKLEQSMCYSEFDDCLPCNPVYLETYELSDSDDEPIEHEMSKMLMLGQVYNSPTPFTVSYTHLTLPTKA